MCDTATLSDVTVQACLESTCVNATGTDSWASQDRVVMGRVTAGLIENRKYLATLLIHDHVHRQRNTGGAPPNPYIHDNSFENKCTIPKDFLKFNMACKLIK